MSDVRNAFDSGSAVLYRGNGTAGTAEHEREIFEDESVDLYREARRAVTRERATSLFAFHVATYVASLLFLGIWNMVTVSRVQGGWWFITPLIFWGVGVIIHYILAVALFDDWWDRDEGLIRQRLDELKKG